MKFKDQRSTNERRFNYVMIAIVFISSWAGFLSITSIAGFLWVLTASWTWMDEAIHHYKNLPDYSSPSDLD